MQPLAQATDLQQIKLVATDMDGTITRRGKFTAELVTTLAKLAEQGIPVLIVTGRSAGWVQGIMNYLPVAGAIAENGGIFYNPGTSRWLIKIKHPQDHRRNLATTYQQIKHLYPNLQESSDNPFRLTDWTFDVQGVSPEQIAQINQICQQQGFNFTYSTIQGHIKLPNQDKAMAVIAVIKEYFPQLSLDQVITVGDSPNDEPMFNSAYFSKSLGVANLKHYQNHLRYLPKYISQGEEVSGFKELADLICR